MTRSRPRDGLDGQHLRGTMAQISSTSPQNRPVLVEILAYAPTQFFHCQHCEVIWQEAGAGKRMHREQLESSIPQDLQKEYADLSDWVHEAVESYGGRVVFQVIDAASMEGFLKSVRYGLRRFPAFIIDGKEKHSGTDLRQAKRLIDARVESVSR
jgi:hypothetical protein